MAKPMFGSSVTALYLQDTTFYDSSTKKPVNVEPVDRHGICALEPTISRRTPLTQLNEIASKKATPDSSYYILLVDDTHPNDYSAIQYYRHSRRA